LPEEVLDFGAPSGFRGGRSSSWSSEFSATARLIAVQPQVFTRLRDVPTVRLVNGSAFLAFDHAGGLATREGRGAHAIDSGAGHRALAP
jgi:hypothetical protein